MKSLRFAGRKSSVRITAFLWATASDATRRPNILFCGVICTQNPHRCSRSSSSSRNLVYESILRICGSKSSLFWFVWNCRCRCFLAVACKTEQKNILTLPRSPFYNHCQPPCLTLGAMMESFLPHPETVHLLMILPPLSVSVTVCW